MSYDAPVPGSSSDRAYETHRSHATSDEAFPRIRFGNWDGGRSTKHDRTYGQGLDAGKDAAWPGVECSD